MKRLAGRKKGIAVLAMGVVGLLCLGAANASGQPAFKGGDWEITPESEAALNRGLEWLAANQTAAGNWESNDLGLVGVGALAFLSAGHMPGVGRYGENVDRALAFIATHAKPSGLLNMAGDNRDMYNHGLATFVLGQAYGMTPDPLVGRTLDRALKLIARMQGPGGGWSYVAKPGDGDLSLCVMQAKALRSAVDSGLEIPAEVIDRAIRQVRRHYHPKHGNRNAPESELQKGPGQFCYSIGGGNATVAMAAAGVVCLQEFGQYDDWRIPKSMEPVTAAIAAVKPQAQHNGTMPFDAYTLNYIGQSLYQVGGKGWNDHYPKLRDCLVASQQLEAKNPAHNGKWAAQGQVGGKPGELYSTSVAVFILAIPNRYLPILQEGPIDGLRQQFSSVQP